MSTNLWADVRPEIGVTNLWADVRPEIVLQVLAELQQHDTTNRKSEI